jgi:hypothetical protein
MYPEAIAQYQLGLNVAPGWPVAWAQIGSVYGVSGNEAGARRILDTLSSLSSRKFVTSYGVALVHMELGEKEQTFVWLNKAYDERSHWLVWLNLDPRWDPIRSDPINDLLTLSAKLDCHNKKENYFIVEIEISSMRFFLNLKSKCIPCIKKNISKMACRNGILSCNLTNAFVRHSLNCFRRKWNRNICI